MAEESQHPGTRRYIDGGPERMKAAYQSTTPHTWHALDVAEVTAALKSDTVEGLTGPEARQRLLSVRSLASPDDRRDHTYRSCPWLSHDLGEPKAGEDSLRPLKR